MKPLLCLLAAVIAGQAQIFYQDPDGTLRVSNLEKGKGGSEKGVFTFKGEGKPLTVEKLEVGLKVTAPRMSGELAAGGEPTKRLSYIRELHGEGGAVVTLDTKAAEEATEELAKKRGTLPPPKAESHGVTQFKTERLDYAGTVERGTFTIPSAFTMTSKSQGIAHRVGEKDATIDVPFTQTINATGVSASFVLNPAQKVRMPLLSGTVEGPMTFDLVRTEKAPGDKDIETMKFSGWADRAVIDLEKERTITFTGNVRVRGENGALIGTSEGDTVVVFLDETLNVVQVQIFGQPAKSTAREKKGGGGETK